MRFIVIVFLFMNAIVNGQTLIHHQALSSQGKGIKLPNGMYVSQIVGRQNIVGNNTKRKDVYGKGNQLKDRKSEVEKKIFPIITTINYPNPFANKIHFQFSKTIDDIITVRIFDVQGKIVFQQENKAYNNILIVELSHLPTSNYTIQLSSLNFIYSAKILKQ